jgi:SOS-response transcriptional repressor LexA
MTKHDKARGDHIIEVIADYTREYGYAPSIREIAERVGLASTAATHYWIKRLLAEGRLLGDYATARSLRVVPPSIPEGTCQRPGCGKPISEKRMRFHARWCSNSCTQIAGHVRAWVRAAGAGQLVAELGL